MDWDGIDRRGEQEAQMGFLKGKIESFETRLEGFKDHLIVQAKVDQKARDKIISDMKEIDKRLDKVMKVWTQSSAVVTTFKYVGIGLLFILTFNLGDIGSWLGSLFE